MRKQPYSSSVELAFKNNLEWKLFLIPSYFITKASVNYIIKMSEVLLENVTIRLLSKAICCFRFTFRFFNKPFRDLE